GVKVEGSDITAADDDQEGTAASAILYEVTDFVAFGSGEPVIPIPFEAVNYNESNKWSCFLTTTSDLTHMAGYYNLTINATDQTDPYNSAQLIVSMQITDANDYEPIINIEGCLADNDQQVNISE
ncbi:uncharacterized protein LOC108680723, partial [Hyalella azteca]|uniref:Uncharacterized protein LOC108680723 n=1 Tax=Hyalella azteca TaxID=294128 RepID=A0A8B7PG28_HYAAZ